MAAERAADPNGLLPKEFEGGDIPTRLYGTHTQTVGWRGMRDMALVWRLIGETALAARYEPEAAAFGMALRTAIDSSKVAVGSSAFVPHDLLSGERPFDPVTGTIAGSYRNLPHPYALASGIVDPAAERRPTSGGTRATRARCSSVCSGSTTTRPRSDR